MAESTFAEKWEANNGRHDPYKLKRYWTRDPRGLAKWADKPHPWTSLFRELNKHMSREMAERCASEWFHDVFGIWSGDRKGKNPLGPG